MPPFAMQSAAPVRSSFISNKSKNAFGLMPEAQTVKKPMGCVEGSQPFDLQSAAGDMRGGEEQLKVASYINLRPQK